MSTLVNKTPRSEYLEGKLFIKDKETGATGDPIPFFYRNYKTDQSIEQQPLKGMQMDKKSNMIYTSAPLVFKGSYEVELEDQSNIRKIKKVNYDRKNSKKTDMRLRGVKDKTLYLGKIIILE